MNLREELHALLARYRSDTPETAAEAPEGAERVSLITQILPELDTSGEDSTDAGPASEPAPARRRGMETW